MWNGYQIGWATPVPGTDGCSVNLFGQDEVVDDQAKAVIRMITQEAVDSFSIDDQAHYFMQNSDEE